MDPDLGEAEAACQSSIGGNGALAGHIVATGDDGNIANEPYQDVGKIDRGARTGTTASVAQPCIPTKMRHEHQCAFSSATAMLEGFQYHHVPTLRQIQQCTPPCCSATRLSRQDLLDCQNSIVRSIALSSDPGTQSPCGAAKRPIGEYTLNRSANLLGRGVRWHIDACTTCYDARSIVRLIGYQWYANQR